MDYITFIYCLTCLRMPEDYVAFLRKNEEFVLRDMKPVVEFFLSYYADRRSFPDFTTVSSCLNFDISSFSLDQVVSVYGSVEDATLLLWDKFKHEVLGTEIKALETQLFQETDDDKKRKLLLEYNRKLANSSDTVESCYVRDYDLPIIAKANFNDPDGLVYPIAKLGEDYGTLPYGHGMTILAPPGAFKTTAAINMVYLNSVARNKNCAYFYLEDMADQYQKKLFSRWSLATGSKIHKDILLRGSDDPVTLDKVQAEWQKYLAARKGEIYYLTMEGFSTDPTMFGHQLAKFVKTHNIDYFILDHCQKLGGFVPAKANKYEYLNQFVAVISACALGAFGSRPFCPVYLSQMSKETIRKGNKSKGHFEIADAAEIGNLERDSVFMMSLWTDDQHKAAGEVMYQVLKARNGVTVTEPVKTYVQPEYSYFGDIPDLQDVYSPSALRDNFSSSDFAAGLNL